MGVCRSVVSALMNCCSIRMLSFLSGSTLSIDLASWSRWTRPLSTLAAHLNRTASMSLLFSSASRGTASRWSRCARLAAHNTRRAVCASRPPCRASKSTASSSASSHRPKATWNIIFAWVERIMSSPTSVASRPSVAVSNRSMAVSQSSLLSRLDVDRCLR